MIKKLQALFKAYPLETTYSLLAFIFGIAFIFLIPPGWNPDEPQHYWRVQQLAHGNIISDQFAGPPGITYTGGKLPSNAADFILVYGGYTGITDYSYRSAFPMWDTPNVHARTTIESPDVDVAFPGSARYSPVVYAPQVAGIWFGNITHMPLLVSFFFAKIFGLLVQIACVAFAIYLIPRGKWIIFILALLPSTITQSVAFGGDVMTTSACLLFIALTLKLAYDTTVIKSKHIATLSFLVFVIGLVKPSYLPLSALILVLPLVRPELRKMKTLAILGGTTFLAALPGVWWLKATSFIQDNFSNGVDPIAQRAYVFEHPWSFGQALFNTYLTDAQPKIYKTILGNFVWDTAPLPIIFMFVGVALIVLMFFLSSSREKSLVFSRAIKLLMGSTAALLIAVISYALYIFFTPLKAASILGIQSRYFIPFFPLLILPFHLKLPQQYQVRIKYTAIALSIAMLVASVVVIVYRIYV